MLKNNQAIREAAMLICTLDSASADLLLDQMDEQQAAQVRAAIMDLDDVDEEQLSGLMSRFLDGESNSNDDHPRPGALFDAETEEPFVESATSDVSLELSGMASNSPVTVHLESSSDGLHDSIETEPAAEDSATFHHLAEMADMNLTSLLLRERPQTIAAVLARLSPELAARELARLAPELQIEVVRRIARLQPVNDDAIAEVEDSLSQALVQQGGSWAEPSQGLQAIQAILASSASPHRQQLLSNLKQTDHLLAQSLQPAAADSYSNMTAVVGHLREQDRAPSTFEAAKPHRHPIDFSFNDLSLLDGESLSKVLLKAEWRVVLLGLAGADRRLMKAISSHLPPTQRQALERQIEQQGPIRLRDVEQAQGQLAEVAACLMMQGEIPPHRSGFTTAV